TLRAFPRARRERGERDGGEATTSPRTRHRTSLPSVMRRPSAPAAAGRGDLDEARPVALQRDGTAVHGLEHQPRARIRPALYHVALVEVQPVAERAELVEQNAFDAEHVAPMHAREAAPARSLRASDRAHAAPTVSAGRG